MRNTNFWSGFGFAIFTLLAIVSILISVITYSAHAIAQGGFLGFLAIHHLWIMLITIVLAIGYGFTSSYFLQKQIVQEQKTSKNILEIVLSFLGKEESDVLKHLVESEGHSTQAKISHINDMGAVKALRTIQKMQDKNLITVEKHGKLRKIVLNQKIYEMLR